MKIASPIFSVLITLFLMLALSVFIAGIFVFLTIQAFYEIYINNGILAAYFWVISGVVIFAFVFFITSRIWFCNMCKKNIKETKITKKSAFGRFFMSVVLYRIVKFLFKRKKA